MGRGANDEEIWAAAEQGGYMIVTKDDDFRSLSFVRGAPPKVIWLSVGNAGTQQIARLLRDFIATIRQFSDDSDGAMLVLRDDAK